MRRIWALAAAVVLVLATVLCVSAANQVTNAGSQATVSSDGTCQVTLTATLRLETAVSDPQVLIPENASDVTLNGSRVSAPLQGKSRVVNLSDLMGNMAGEFTISLHYTISGTVATNEEGILQLTVPLLSGFDYPVSAMEFSVTLPGEITTEPGFSSGYHQASIEKDLTYSVTGATVAGRFTKALKDHATLEMTLPLSKEIFPQPAVQVQSLDVGLAGMWICVGLAMLYWLLFLRAMPVLRQTNVQPVEGFGAGQMGSVLHMQGTDLTLMVLTWAQRGYLTIRQERNGRIRLYKRMDMGNECSEFELRLFRKLFGRASVADTSGYGYAELRGIASKKPAGVRELLRSGSGNLRLFRILASGLGLFGGMCVGLELGNGAVLQWLLALALAAVGAYSGWILLLWGIALETRKAGKLVLCGVIIAGWLIFGSLAGTVNIALWTVIGLLVFGILYTIGGRRTDFGRQTKAQVLGLRHYMKTASKDTVRRLYDRNPDYYFMLAPYAIALGVGKPFAKAFGGIPMECPYFANEKQNAKTALQWHMLLSGAVNSMDDRYRRLRGEKLKRLIANSKRR